MTTTFNPSLAPALLADPANNCAATLSTAMSMAALMFEGDYAADFQQHLHLSGEADAIRIRALVDRLAALSQDINAFRNDCRSRVAGVAQ